MSRMSPAVFPPGCLSPCSLRRSTSSSTPRSPGAWTGATSGAPILRSAAAAPGNKYFENGDFASTETLFCRLHVKACIDVTLTRLEREIAAGNSAAEPYGRDRA